MPIANNFTKLEIYGKKAILQINRPDALNSLNQQVLQEIHENCLLLQNNKEITVVIVCGSGEKAFVAGADIKEMQAFKSCESAQQFSQNGSKAFLALENLPQITIARIQGFALGGGLELALACDFIIASEKARFGLPEVTLGLIPGFGGTQRLARRIGTPRALEWITSAEKYSATEAYGYGLINHVTKHEDLISFTEQMTEKILKTRPMLCALQNKL